MIGLVASIFTAVLVLGRGVHFLSHEVPWAGTRRHPHDGSGPTVPAVRCALHRPSLDGSGRRSNAGIQPADAGQPGAQGEQYGKVRMDAAQSSCALGIGHVLDVSGSLEISFSLS